MPPIRTRAIRPVLDRLAAADSLGDAEALRRFRRRKDHEAFAVLVRRYGPLVAGVCRRVLGPRPEADDAVQATFWALARRAGSIRRAVALPAWLHAVAYRTARKAAVRLTPPPENQPTPAAPDDPLADASWREVRQMLDEEVHRLPPRLRLPVLLCYFEDLTRDEAADRLGWSLSTVKRRLDQARDRLKLRLIRRGVAPGLLGATALLADRLTARVPPALEAACTSLAHQPPVAAIRALAATSPTAGKWLLAAAAIIGLGWGLVTVAGQGQPAEPKTSTGEPKAKVATASPPAEPLPPGALARFGTTRYRADQPFWFASFSQDGRWMVSGTDGVELWDLETGLRKQIMPVRNNTVPRPRLSPDGRLIAVLDGGPGLHLFDRKTGKELRTVGEGTKYNDCRFTPDGKRVLAITREPAPTATAFTVGDGTKGPTVPVPVPAERGLGVENDRALFLVSSGGRGTPLTVRVVDPETGKDSKVFETGVTDCYELREDDRAGFRTGIRPRLDLITVAPDFSHLAYRRSDEKLGVVALTPGSKPRPVELPADFRASLFWFAPDGKSLFASDFGGHIVRCDADTGKQLATFSGNLEHFGQWHIDPAGKVLTTAGGDGRIRRWDLTTNKEVPLATGGYQKAVKAVFTADGRLVVGDRIGTIDLFDPRSGRLVQEVPRWRDGTDWYTFAVSPDGRTLVATRPEGKLFWFDLAAGKELATMKLPGPVPDQMYKSIQGMAFTPDGRRLVCSYQDGRLFAVDTQTRKEIWRVGLPTDRDWDAAVAFTVSADGRHLARGLRRGGRTGDWGYGLQVLDTATGRSVRLADVSETKGKEGLPDLMDARYTPDGRFVVLVSRNGHVQVRHPDTLAEISSWTTGSKYAITLDVSPDGRLVLTGDDAGTVQVWEVLTGKRATSVRGHRGTVASAVVSPDGRLLATGGYDQVAYTWSLKPATVPDRPLEGLAGDDAEAAYRAIWALAADPDGPKVLRERFPPAAGPTPETIRDWIADLDHATFARREAASAALVKAGPLTEPAVRRALDANPSPEARERLTKVLAGISHKPSRDDVIHARAVHAMELANTPAARKVLEEWAGGMEGTWLTTDARSALQRLRAR